ncbi:MAG: hypothetical protein FJ211_02915 [Ignavibacteria bacterium]|nr:hypothetical protein [Ignavibacteria bacterium]
MSRSACYLFMVLTSAAAVAQQIPWNPSMRQPYSAPRIFVGLDASVGIARHDAHLQYLDELYGIPCCTYDAGRSTPLSIGVTAEYWVLPTSAVTFSVGIRSESTRFEATPSVLPRNGLPPVTTQYVFDSQAEWLALGIGAKTRLFSSPLTIAANLGAHVRLGSGAIHREVILGPNDFYFVTDPPAKEYQLPAVGLSDISTVVLRPSLAIAYDVPLTYGYYLAPSIRIETTAQSISQRYKWNSTVLSVGFAFYKGL